MDCHSSTRRADWYTAAPAAPARSHPLARLWALLLTWQRRADERQALREMDSRLRRDIGVSESDVLAEASKPFWRP
mgnify:CR=1 FL=1